MINSRAKGANGELEAAEFLTAHGFPARRAQQYQGVKDGADLICPTLEEFGIEVKRTQRTDIYGWLEKALASDPDKVPLILHRKDREKWVVILDAEMFLALVREK